MSAVDHARKALATLIAQGHVRAWADIEAIVLAACEAAAAEATPRCDSCGWVNNSEARVEPHQPIDTWLLAAPFRMVTLMVDREQKPPRIVAMLDEGMLERGRSSGATCAEANANALNDVMGRQYK